MFLAKQYKTVKCIMVDNEESLSNDYCSSASAEYFSSIFHFFLLS